MSHLQSQSTKPNGKLSGGVFLKLLTWYAVAGEKAGGKSSRNRNSDKV